MRKLEQKIQHLLFIFLTTSSLYSSTLTHKIYWSFEQKNFSVTNIKDINVIYKKDYVEILDKFVSYGKGFVKEINLSFVEVSASYPGVGDFEIFVSELKKIASNTGANIVVLSKISKYMDSNKISDVSADIYRFQYKRDNSPISGFVLTYLFKNYLEIFSYRVQNYEKYGNELGAIGIIDDKKFNKLFSQLYKNIENELKVRYINLEEVSEGKIIMFYKKLFEGLSKLKEEFPEEYEKFNKFHKKYYHTTLEEFLKIDKNFLLKQKEFLTRFKKFKENRNLK